MARPTRATLRSHCSAKSMRICMRYRLDARLAVERRLIDFEAPGVYDGARRRVNRHSDAIGHAVSDAQELDTERTERYDLARLHPCETPPRALLELLLEER